MSATVLLEIQAELSEHDRTERAKEAARLTEQLDKMADEFKDSRADWRRRIKDVKIRRDDSNKAFMLGTEAQKLECIEHVNLEKKQAEYIHAGRVVKTRDLTMDELARVESIPLFDDTSHHDVSEMKQVIQGETSKKSKKDLVSA